METSLRTGGNFRMRALSSSSSLRTLLRTARSDMFGTLKPMMHPHDRTRRVKKLTVRSADTVIQEMRAFKVTEVADAGYGRGHTCTKGGLRGHD